MGITFHKNFDKIHPLAGGSGGDGGIPPHIERLLGRILLQERTEIRRRTAGGKDVGGRQFRQYSKGYGAEKKESKRTSGTVDLTWTGGMLGAMQSDVKNHKTHLIGRLYVANTTTQRHGRKRKSKPPTNLEKAQFHQLGLGKNPVRKFFGVDRKQLNRIYRRIKEAL